MREQNIGKEFKLSSFPILPLSVKTKTKSQYGNIGSKMIKLLLYLKKHHLDIEDLFGVPLYSSAHTLPDSKLFFIYVKTGNISKVTLMLHENKMHLYQIDHVGKTPAHWAAIRQNGIMILLFIRFNAEIERCDLAGKTPLSYALANDDFETAKVNIKDNEATTNAWCEALERFNSELPSILKRLQMQ